MLYVNNRAYYIIGYLFIFIKFAKRHILDKGNEQKKNTFTLSAPNYLPTTFHSLAIGF
jgi:hypothetical protein